MDDYIAVMCAEGHLIWSGLRSGMDHGIKRIVCCPSCPSPDDPEGRWIHIYKTTPMPSKTTSAVCKECGQTIILNQPFSCGCQPNGC